MKVENHILRIMPNSTLYLDGDISGVGFISSSSPTILGMGSLSPGDPESTKGNLWMGPLCDLRNKTLNIQLFGNEDNDAINLRTVTQESFLDGTLNVTLEDDYLPEIGHRFTIINSAAVIDNTVAGNDTDFTGKSFSTLNLPTLPDDRKWAIDYSKDGVVLSVEDASLPVTLASFNGYSEGKENVLKWTTANEIQHSHFEIERSFNGTDFELIGRIDGVATIHNSQSYTFVDQTFKTELSYYRLRQVDLDGSAEFSKIISIKNSPPSSLSRVYPNPVDDILLADLQSESPVYTISDMSGKTVLSGLWNFKKEISTAELGPGIYFLRSGSEVIRFIKK